jgi:hypothetical protein
MGLGEEVHFQNDHRDVTLIRDLPYPQTEFFYARRLRGLPVTLQKTPDIELVARILVTATSSEASPQAYES